MTDIELKSEWLHFDEISIKVQHCNGVYFIGKTPLIPDPFGSLAMSVTAWVKNHNYQCDYYYKNHDSLIDKMSRQYYRNRITKYDSNTKDT